MGKPVSTQVARPPAPKQRAAASVGPARDTPAKRTRSAGSPSLGPEVPAAKPPGLELNNSGGFIWS
jgi:hypothetical protein